MRRRKAVALLLAGTLLSTAAAVAADAGSAGDPLIALNWLKNTFMPNAVTTAGERIDARTGELYQEVVSAQAGGVELRVKRGDVLRLETGSGILPLAGSLSGTASGAIVDVTDGVELAANSALTAHHRYLTAEQSIAAYSVTSDTAVVRITGSYALSPSTQTDYNAMADALKAMGLFKGSDVGYGSGYELERAPTRIQGLIMFLRLMGEEAAALAYPGNGITYADVPDWVLPYVAYAYDKGYTKGVGIDEQWRVWFGTENTLTANDYVTFLLRALGYSEAGDFAWLTAVADAQKLSVLTTGEEALLTGGSPFLRAQVAYLSYVSLSAQIKGEGGTLLERLTTSGILSADVASSAMKTVTTPRL